MEEIPLAQSQHDNLARGNQDPLQDKVPGVEPHLVGGLEHILEIDTGQQDQALDCRAGQHEADIGVMGGHGAEEEDSADQDVVHAEPQELRVEQRIIDLPFLLLPKAQEHPVDPAKVQVRKVGHEKSHHLPVTVLGGTQALGNQDAGQGGKDDVHHIGEQGSPDLLPGRLMDNLHTEQRYTERAPMGTMDSSSPASLRQRCRIS